MKFNITDKLSASTAKGVSVVFLLITLSTISFFAFGFWYMNSLSRLNTGFVNELENINDSNVKVTKIGYKRLEKDEAEIFRLILKYSDSLSTLEAYNLAKVINDECESRDLDPSLVLSVIMVESNFMPDAISRKGAVGLMQLMPTTGSYVAKREGISISGKKELYDPEINVRLGIAYLSFLNSQFQNIEEALGAYNYGPNRYMSLSEVSEPDRLLPKYVYKVLKIKNTFDTELVNYTSS